MSVRKRGDSYLVTYTTGEKDKHGKKLQRHFQTFKLKKEADTFYAQVRVDIKNGVHVPASKSITIAEAGRNWLDACHDLERTTVDGYRQHLTNQILPRLGGMKLSALTVGIVRDWQDKLRKDGASADLVRRVTVSLGSLLADAQERTHVATNVVRGLKSKRRTERRAKARLKVGTDIPTPAEIDRILAAAQGRWRVFLLVAIRCGLRASELRGLRWADVDFAKAELHVSQRADAYNAIGRPKSESGDRRVPIPPTTLQALREWKIKQGPGRELVFGTSTGKPDGYANVTRRGTDPIVKAAGLQYRGLHCYRHFFASWCINPKADGGLEMPLKAVSEIMGHSNISITADLYGHLFPRGDISAELAAAEGKFG